MKQLYDKKSLPEMQMVEVETRLQQARSMYELSKKNMNDCALHAPFAGVVGRRTAEVGLTSMFGFISLLGMIMKNVILMYQHAEDERHLAHRSARDAAYDAGARRMTPIFLTTATTAVGVIPMIIEGSSFWSPVGVSIFAGGIGALIAVVTVLPVLYWKLYGKEDQKRQTREGGRSSRNAHGVNVST